MNLSPGLGSLVRNSRGIETCHEFHLLFKWGKIRHGPLGGSRTVYAMRGVEASVRHRCSTKSRASESVWAKRVFGESRCAKNKEQKCGRTSSRIAVETHCPLQVS
jgi:hypothetical protein